MAIGESMHAVSIQYSSSTARSQEERRKGDDRSTRAACLAGHRLQTPPTPHDTIRCGTLWHGAGFKKYCTVPGSTAEHSPAHPYFTCHAALVQLFGAIQVTLTVPGLPTERKIWLGGHSEDGPKASHPGNRRAAATAATAARHNDDGAMLMELASCLW